MGLFQLAFHVKNPISTQDFLAGTGSFTCSREGSFLFISECPRKHSNPQYDGQVDLPSIPNSENLNACPLYAMDPQSLKNLRDHWVLPQLNHLVITDVSENLSLQAMIRSFWAIWLAPDGSASSGKQQGFGWEAKVIGFSFSVVWKGSRGNRNIQVSLDCCICSGLQVSRTNWLPRRRGGAPGAPSMAIVRLWLMQCFKGLYDFSLDQVQPAVHRAQLLIFVSGAFCYALNIAKTTLSGLSMCRLIKTHQPHLPRLPHPSTHLLAPHNAPKRYATCSTLQRQCLRARVVS